MDDDLFYPEINVELGPYGLSQGIEIEVYSSADSYFDWGKVRFTDRFQEQISVAKRDAAVVKIGYNGNLDEVFQGFVVSPYSGGSNQDEIILKDAMVLLEDTLITNTFLDATPQEILSFCLGKAGISEARISSKIYAKKASVPIFRKNVISVIETVHSLWKIKEPFFFSSGVFYWGEQPEQDKIYEFEYAENIVSLEKFGGLWQLETVAAPFVRHSHLINVSHPKVSGQFAVKKVVFTTEVTGFIRTKIYF
ncbi:hypothetical protein [Paenibacillus sanguinis]|uniref:hypothetical protein n=1 Tax=Paenibacillus sanguinis TaxID=225906 RepID=UPI00037F5F97|nr:hypothetical protein [Paenibacillus sanguinis]